VSLRLRLVILLSILFLCVIASAAVALLANTRANVGAEARATIGLVRALAGETACSAGVPASTVATIDGTRHLRIEPLVEHQYESRVAPHATPHWFERMVSPSELPEPVPVRVSDGPRPFVLVAAAPGDEIDEAWEDLADSLTYAVALFVVLCLATAIVVTRELAPLATLGDALQRVESGALDARMPHVGLPEIARLCVGFNRMAAALGEAQSTNRELTRRILGVQEAERRALARELHDEFGQHLTAIRADAAALLAPNATTGTARLSGRAIEQTAHTLMRQLRSMLERLRPEALDDLGLCVALQDLAASFRMRNLDIVVALDLPDSVDVDDERAIALYRVAQEALTNIARHAGASRVVIRVSTKDGLELEVRDDGRGLPDSARIRGFGLLGMRERIDSCGGLLTIGAGPGGRGTVVRAKFPRGES